jgi:diguanylate cyclase (GGDEF)-like protein
MREQRPFFYLSLVLCLLPALALVWPAGDAALDQLLGDGERWLQGLTLGLSLLSFAAWRLNQTRLVFVAFGLLCTAFWLWSRLSVDGPQAVATEDAWLFVFPAGLALALLPGEAALFSQRSAARLSLLFLPALLLWAAASADGVATNQLLNWRAWGPPGSHHPSHLAHLSLGLFAAVLWFRRDAKLGPAQAVLAGSVLGQAGLAWATRWHGGGAILVARCWLLSHALQAALLGLALFFMYWQRVYLDELTGIPNRRALDERFTHLGRDYSLAMVDIDHFKKFNDTYGHDQGDDVLRLVGKHLADGSKGRAFRYGGEEFCVLMEGEDPEAAEALMEGIRASLAAQRFHIRLPKSIRKKTGPEDRGSLRAQTAPVQVTISVGVAAPDNKALNPSAVMKRADQGLYKAKENGRNNVVRMS